MNVNEEKLTELLQNLVEGFNDCVCCPLTYECDRDGDIDPITCAENLKSYLTN